MVIIREFNKIADGYSADRNESYRIVRGNIKRYWKEHNGKVLHTKKIKTRDYIYCNYIVRITY